MVPLKFAQILSSRLCHDLIAPAGAIASGLEILQETEPGQDSSDILKIIEQSAQGLTKKLIFYRAAFGYSSAAQFSEPNDIRDFLESFLETKKVSLLFESQPGHKLVNDYPNWGRLIAHLTLILTEIAPRGGMLKVCWTSSALELSLTGSLVSIRDSNRDALLGHLDQHSITPHEIQPYIAYLLMTSLGVSFSKVSFSTEEVLFSIESSKTLFD